MEQMTPLFVVVGLVQTFILTAMGCILVAILTRQKNNRLYRLMMVISIAGLIQNAGYLLEFRSRSAAEALAAIRMEYIAGSFMATFFLILILMYCGHQLPMKKIMIFLGIDSLVVFSVWTCEFNRLYYTSVDFTLDAQIPHVILGKGILYYINALCMVVQLMVGLVIAGRAVKNAKDSRQRKSNMIVLGSLLLPFTAYFMGLSGVLEGFDPVPCGVGLGIIALGSAILFFHVFDLVEIAHDNIIETMEEIVLIVDYNYGFAEANQKANTLFPQLRQMKKGDDVRESELAFLFTDHENEELVIDGRTYNRYVNEIIVDNFVSGYTFLLFDITQERKQLERMQQLKEEADRANETKSRFLANVSHEIRTPINAVLGMDEMILRESREAETKKYASDIKAAAKTLLSIINDVLDSSKIESGKMEIVPVEYELAGLLGDVYRMMEVRAQDKQLEYHFDVDSELPQGLYGDDIRIRQILLNLLSNSIKYTSEGKVSLGVKGTIQEEQVILQFEVIDTGIGIKPENQAQLFEEFERVDLTHNRNIEGTGLGLSITAQLLRLMGSTLKVESTYGVGSRFYFTLMQPITDKEPIGTFDEYLSRTISGDNYGATFVAPKAHVLVVDDNKINRDVFRGLLKQTQIKIEEADSGLDCLMLVEKERYDIIFMDDMMPGMSGQETLKQIQKDGLCPDTPIIMLTANAVTGAREDYIGMGFTDFLTKPIEPQKLEALIGRILPKEYVRWSVAELENGLSSNTDVLPQIECVDWDYARLHLTDTALLRQTAVSFVQSIPTEVDSLQRLIDCVTEEQYLAEYRIRVHAIKSTAAMLGIVTVSGVAALAEKAAGQEDIVRLQRLHESLVEELKVYEERLQQLCPQEDKLELTELQSILPVLEQLKGALIEREYDIADEMMEQLIIYRYEDEMAKQMTRLQTQVMNLEAENGSATAEYIINEIKRMSYE